MGNPADALTRQLDDVLDAGHVFVPGARPVLVDRALFGRGNHRLVSLAMLRDPFEDAGQSLVVGGLRLQRFRHDMGPERDTEQIDIRAQFAEHPDARKPARGDFHRVGVDHLHAADRQQAHAGHRDQHECDHGDDLGADRKCGHGWLSQALETGAAEL